MIGFLALRESDLFIFAVGKCEGIAAAETENDIFAAQSDGGDCCAVQRNFIGIGGVVGDNVVAFGVNEDIGTCAAREGIIARAAGQSVVAFAANQ